LLAIAGIVALLALALGGSNAVAHASAGPHGPRPQYVDCSITEEVNVRDTGVLVPVFGVTVDTILNELRDVNTQHYCGHLQAEEIVTQGGGQCHSFTLGMVRQSDGHAYSTVTNTPACGAGGTYTKSYALSAGACYYVRDWVDTFPNGEVDGTPFCP